ncbi:MAG TPA: hypothetical protein VLO10_02895 [Candidatus Deferrimicrobium sp.]|nr:hypothetical protein [Candidatus Deferrimicrobium sp.]
MPPEDDFRRDRDQRTQRSAIVAGAILVMCLAALLTGVLVRRSQPTSTSALPAATATPHVSAAPPSLTPSPTPAIAVLGSGFSSVYDARIHRLVAIGGVDSYDTTWMLDGHRWTLVQPSPSPPGRFQAAAAFDPLTGVVMLYGGRLGPGEIVNDTWAWDGRSWRELDAGTGNPPGGEGSRMAWDDVHKLMVLVNGAAGSSGSTWTWDGSHWVRQASGDLPSGDFPIGLVSDPVTHMLLAAVCCADPNGATTTLAWNGSAWRTLSTRTVPTFTVAVVRDPGSARLLMFADPSTSTGADAWSWTGQDWAPLTGTRPPVFPAGAVTDVDTGHVVIVGAVVEPVQGNPQPVQVWSLTGSTWTRLG